MKYRTIETQIPWKYKWKAIDKSGVIAVFTHKPEPAYNECWESGFGLVLEIGHGPKPKDWTKTLEKL